jgi:DNA invertase Pin-like site-specific DNA recombinase
MMAATYARTASPDEGIQLQVDRLRRLARNRGMEIVAEYNDVGSGPKGRRPGLNSLVAAAGNGQFSVVLTTSLDRLAKNTNHLLQLVEDFRTLHIDLISAQEDIDTTTSAGKTFFNAAASISQCQSQLVRENIRQGLRRRKLDGFKLGRSRLPVSCEAIARDRLSMSLTQVAQKYGISRASVVRFVREAQRQAIEAVPYPPIAAEAYSIADCHLA